MVLGFNLCRRCGTNEFPIKKFGPDRLYCDGCRKKNHREANKLWWVYKKRVRERHV